MALYDSANREMWQSNDPKVDSAEAYYEREYNVALSDINVFVGENVRENTKAAYRKALSLLGTGFFPKILVINTSARQHWALKVGREMDAERIGDEAGKPISVVGNVMGDLCKHIEMIKEKVKRGKFSAVIINSWEFASENGRYKDKLLFALREMIEECGITVIIYSHHTKVTSADVGRPMAGSLGKLCAIAGFICSVEVDESGVWKQSTQAPTAKAAEVVEEEIQEDISTQYIKSDGTLDPKMIVPLKLMHEPEFVSEESEDVLELAEEETVFSGKVAA